MNGYIFDLTAARHLCCISLPHFLLSYKMPQHTSQVLVYIHVCPDS